MKKTVKKALALGLGLGFSLLAAGCGFFPMRTIVSVEKTASEGLVDTYTITYSDGTFYTFEITNGADGEDGKNGAQGVSGKDGKDVTARELYEEYVAQYGEISYAEFLGLYFTLSTDDVSTLHETLLSTAKIYAAFTETVATEKKAIASTGSAVLYAMDSENAYFLTNYHVIYEEKADAKIFQELHCYMYGNEGHPQKETNEQGEEYFQYEEFALPCEYIGGAATYDLALLKVEKDKLLSVSPSAKPVKIASQYFVGETAIAVGNPKDKGVSVTKGIVSVYDDLVQLTIGGIAGKYYSFRMDTPLYKGNSGGGVFNVQGELIGLAHAGDSESQNINYAIPAPLIKSVVENIMRHYFDGDDDTFGVYKPTIGVSVVAENPRFIYDEINGYGVEKEDVKVKEISQNSIAQTLGLQAGDILKAVEIDGITYALEKLSALGNYLLKTEVGSTIAMIYQRNGTEYITDIYELKADEIITVA